MFGGTFGQSQPAGGGLFGSTNTAQPTGGLFGSANTAQKPGGLFGSTTTTGAQNQGGGLFGGAGQNTQQTQQNQQQTGGLFGGGLGASTQQNQPQAGGLFGTNAQQPQQQQPGGLFSGQTMGAQQQAAQQQQNTILGGSQQQTGLFGQTQSSQALGQSQGQFGNSLFTNTSALKPREKSVIDQIETVVGKWDTGSKDCAFQYFFYNNVGVDEAPFYQPQPNEDPRAWEEALSKKPGPGYIPVACIGFQMMGNRIKAQQNHLAAFNIRLHDINASLSNLLQNHDTRTSIRAMDARRKHVVLKQRCIALATKVQVLRNRGYALSGDEEDLKAKLIKIEKGASDPALGARAEEIWARMINVQERGRLLRTELEKVGQENGEILDDTMTARCKKILEDYQTQLAHLKKELDRVHKDYVEWEKEQPPQVAARTRFGR